MQNPLISVILPTHNRADVLPFAIESILNQTHSNLELFIVGDGCTDQTSEIVSGYKDPRINWLDLPKGPGFGYANRNIAYKKAAGEFVAFMAHDDIAFEDHLSILLQGFSTRDIDLVYNRPIWITPDGVILISYFNLNCKEILSSFTDFRCNEIPASCVMFRRECLDRIGYWNDSLPACADWDFWIRILKSSENKNFNFINTPGTIHFHANWKKKNEMPGDLLRDRFRSETDCNNFPHLKINLENNISEQQQIWHIIKNDGKSWIHNIRSEIQKLSDERIYWSEKIMGRQLISIEDYFNEISAYKAQVNDLHGQLHKLQSNNEILRHKMSAFEAQANRLSQIENSKGWRLLNKYREFRASLIGR